MHEKQIDSFPSISLHYLTLECELWEADPPKLISEEELLKLHKNGYFTPCKKSGHNVAYRATLKVNRGTVRISARILRMPQLIQNLISL